MARAGDEMTEQWWITLQDNGDEKLMGPFCSRLLALEVRAYVEAVPQSQRHTPLARSQATFAVAEVPTDA